METFAALLTLCSGNSRWIPLAKPVTGSFDVFIDLHPNKWLSKQSRHRWFETLPRSLWPEPIRTWSSAPSTNLPREIWTRIQNALRKYVRKYFSKYHSFHSDPIRVGDISIAFYGKTCMQSYTLIEISLKQSPWPVIGFQTHGTGRQAFILIYAEGHLGVNDINKRRRSMTNWHVIKEPCSTNKPLCGPINSDQQHCRIHPTLR